ncbi:MAG: YggT family protein [Candidatus Planktophila sp.]|nr:YggT family protein [Candidatus Planktophila sp.]
MITNLLLTLLDLFKYALFIRLIIDYVRIFARNWRPNSFLIAVFEFIYTLTDPPMKFVGRFVPPLRLGGVSLDLSFIVLLIAIGLVKSLIVVLF